LRYQVLNLLGRELEHKIHREALGVALDSLIESAGGHAVDCGEFAIENDALTAQDHDAAGDILNGDGGLGLCHGA
jgi:hypothetical protein